MFTTRSSRACALLAGLVAGLATASTAFAPGAPAQAPGAPPPVVVETPEPAGDVAVGRLRVHEAAIAESEYRRSQPVAAARSSSRPRTGRFLRPAAGAVTGSYGERRGRGRHPGVDIDGSTGDPVVAASAGTVIVAGWAPSGYSGYGRMVMIDHGNGITTLYAHLSKVAVSDGQRVEAGQYLGAIGTTGSSTGSHLHFEVRAGGSIVNPAGWI